MVYFGLLYGAELDDFVMISVRNIKKVAMMLVILNKNEYIRSMK